MEEGATLKVPMGHAVQVMDPVVLVKEPATQGWQVEPKEEYIPTLHDVQDVPFQPCPREQPLSKEAHTSLYKVLPRPSKCKII